MTIQQLYYILEVAKAGSLNRAAKELFVSQSCISISIRKLEQELGFSIFVRSPHGTTLTEKGQKLIEEAGTIMASMHRISQVQSSDTSQHTSAVFRLLHMRYLASYFAFSRLCAEYEAADFFQFSFHSISGQDQKQAIDAVNRNACDCVAFCGPLSAEFLLRCRQQKVVYQEICANVPFVLNLSKQHPLLTQGVPEYAEELLPNLTGYPFVSYGASPSSLFLQKSLPDCIDPNKMIHISSMALRTDLVANTFGFSISLPHKQQNDQVLSIPFRSGEHYSIGLLYSQIRGLSPIGQRYLELFQQELSFLSEFYVTCK